MPEYPAENTIDESLSLGEIAAEPRPVEYNIIPSSSECCGDKLVDSHGFSYGVRLKNNKCTLWRCSVHNAQVHCLATIHQEEDVFTPGPHPHLHHPLPGIANSLQAREKINSQALSEVFMSAAEITEKVLAENFNNEPTPALSSNAQLAQNANHLCQHHCPKDPKNFHFDSAEDFIPPGFFQKDIYVNGHHYLLFATDKMI